MRPPSRVHSRGELQSLADQSMTSMIDVVFLLLVFFVCAAVGRAPERLVATPLSGGSVDATMVEAPPEQIEEVRITLLREGDATIFAVTSVAVPDAAAVEAKLRTLAKLLVGETWKTPVLLDVGPDVPMEDVLEVYHAAEQVGYETIRFVART